MQPEDRDAHPEIAWHHVVGQRNILAHEYGQIDYEMLYQTVINDIPLLATQLRPVLPPIEE